MTVGEEMKRLEEALLAEFRAGDMLAELKLTPRMIRLAKHVTADPDARDMDIADFDLLEGLERSRDEWRAGQR